VLGTGYQKKFRLNRNGYGKEEKTILCLLWLVGYKILYEGRIMVWRHLFWWSVLVMYRETALLFDVLDCTRIEMKIQAQSMFICILEFGHDLFNKMVDAFLRTSWKSKLFIPPA